MADESSRYPRESPTFALVAVLWVLTLATQIGGLFYRMAGAPEPGQSLLRTFLVSSAFLSAITVPAAVIGLRLSRQIGALGAPLLGALLERHPGAWERLKREATLAVPVGLGLGVVMLLLRFALEQYLPPGTPALGSMGVIGGLLASIGAAVGEEIWSRLAVMTILAWLILRFRNGSVLTPGMAWSANVLAALVFGMMHLPSVAQNDAFTPFAAAGTIFGNTVVGTFYGWLYWKRSLVAAMIGHFSVDVVLHVFTAFGQ
jgi:hypothetical protein